MKDPEPRAHHFAPQCWLAGFTETGQKNSRLWVTDLTQWKQWPSTLKNAAHVRDLYRVSGPVSDPVIFEKKFSEIETVIAPIFKRLFENPREPTKDELENLLMFAAFQYVRVPSFRPHLLRIAESIHRSVISAALTSPASWSKALNEAGIPPDTPGAEYDSVLKFWKSGEFWFSAENECFLIRGFQLAIDAILPALESRHWATIFSENGGFITSDDAVCMDGPRNKVVGFKSAEVVVFPVNRFISLSGTPIPMKKPVPRLELTAHFNTFIMLNAEKQLYSHVPSFCWLDHSGRYQSDWGRFCKEKFRLPANAGRLQTNRS